ncbi:MAG: cupin domain-containing protein [Spirochaetota bacterium]|nr:MAG: cupin domain-containing protein [Spirochaetota bacterium]
MIIVHEESAPGLDIKEPFKRTLKVLLSPLINKELKSIAAGLTIIPSGGKSDNHEHPEGEMFYVVSGKGSIQVGEEVEVLIPGTAVWVQPGTSHQLCNDSDATLKILWVLSPPGREKAIIDKMHKT